MSGFVCLKQRLMMEIFNIINWQDVSRMVTVGEVMEPYIKSSERSGQR